MRSEENRHRQPVGFMPHDPGSVPCVNSIRPPSSACHFRISFERPVFPYIYRVSLIVPSVARTLLMVALKNKRLLVCQLFPGCASVVRNEQTDGKSFYCLSILLLVEVIKECSYAFEGRLTLSFNFNGEGDLSLADTAEILDALQCGIETDAAAGEYRLAEAHLVHTVVDHHLQVVHLDDLVPEVRKE